MLICASQRHQKMKTTNGFKHIPDFFILIFNTTRLRMGPSLISSRPKYAYKTQGINKHGLKAQIWRYWIDLNKRLPQPKILWYQVIGPHPLEVLENKQPLAGFYQTNKIYIITRGILNRWEGKMRQGICLLAHKSSISLIIFAQPRRFIRIINTIGRQGTIQSQVRPKNKSFIINSQDTVSPSEDKIQQILTNKQQIAQQIHIQSSLYPDSLQYLLNLTRFTRSKRIATNIILTFELNGQRMDVPNHIVKIVQNQQQRLLEEGFAILRAKVQARKEQESLMETELLQYIHETCERNQPIRAQLAHFLLPYGLILRMLQLKSPPYRHSAYINGLIKFILGQMRRGEIKGQLGEWVREGFLQVFTKEETSYEEIKEYLKKFLVAQKRPMSEIAPYYYNFFALLINQEAYFQGGDRKDLLQYTIQLEIPFFDKDQVGWTEIFGVIQHMEVGLRKRYQSKYV